MTAHCHLEEFPPFYAIHPCLFNLHGSHFPHWIFLYPLSLFWLEQLPLFSHHNLSLFALWRILENYIQGSLTHKGCQSQNMLFVLAEYMICTLLLMSLDTVLSWSESLINISELYKPFYCENGSQSIRQACTQWYLVWIRTPCSWLKLLSGWGMHRQQFTQPLIWEETSLQQ